MDPPATWPYLPLPKSSGDPPPLLSSPAPVELRPPMLTCVARFTGTFVAIDFVDAPAVVTRFALAVVQVDLAIETCGFGHMFSHTAGKKL